MYGTVYGNTVPAGEWTPARSVIGRVEQSISGNTILRVGRENHDGTWSQTEHVVLTPAETTALMVELGVQRLSNSEVGMLQAALDQIDGPSAHQVMAQEG